MKRGAEGRRPGAHSQESNEILEVKKGPRPKESAQLLVLPTAAADALLVQSH